jgi:CRP/FNR family transcriptional regulator
MKTLAMGPDEIRHLSAALKKMNFFSGMSMADMERFIRVTNLYEFPSGKTVFKKGQVGDALYVVHTGVVRVLSKPFFLWPAKTIATLGPSQVFGEMALLDQPYRTATVVTKGTTQLFVLLATHFNDILRDNPAFARELKNVASTRAFERQHQ